MKKLFEEEERTEAELLKDRVSSRMRYLLSPLYSVLVPRLMDDFYDKYLDDYLMVGACIAEVKRIKREHNIMKKRCQALEKEKQIDIKEFIQ